MGEEGKPETEQKTCFTRFQELAVPNKRLLADVWYRYAYLFTADRREAIRNVLQEMFALTPEEAGGYFGKINEVLDKYAAREKLKDKFRRIYKERLKLHNRAKAFELFGRVMCKILAYASRHSIPALVSPRLRSMSDVVLAQLCELRGIGVPKRTSNDTLSLYLINVSDWLALAIEQLYYRVSCYKNRELQRIEDEIREEEAKKKAKVGKKRSKSKSSEPSTTD